jgi:hypothetical protein
MSDDEWGGNEMQFDEAPTRGVHRISADNIRIVEEGVVIEADCPNCQDTTTIEIPWTELVQLAVGREVPGLSRVRAGYIARAACEACVDRLMEAQVSERRARKGATADITISMDEVFAWVRKGRTAGKISRRQLALIKQAHGRGGPAQSQPPPQAQPRRGPGRPQARRRPGGIQRRRRGS